MWYSLDKSDKEREEIEMINLWGAAVVLLILTCLFIGSAMWAKGKDWDSYSGDFVGLVFLGFGGGLIGFWCAWLYKLLVAALK